MLLCGHSGTNPLSTIACRPGLSQLETLGSTDTSFWFNTSRVGA
jgi:hypothetical protein